MTNKPHPHAEILRAIADGEPLSEFEVTSSGLTWLNVKDAKMTDWFFSDPHQWQVRRKQRTHVVNGFTVPAPMNEELEEGGRLLHNQSAYRRILHEKFVDIFQM